MGPRQSHKRKRKYDLGHPGTLGPTIHTLHFMYDFRFKRERGKARLGPKILGVTSYELLILKPPPVPTSRFRYVVIFMDFGGSPRAGADHQNLHGLRSKSPTSDTIARVTPSCLSAVPTISRSPFTFGPLRGKAAVGIRWVPMFENDVPINARRSFPGHV
jgi:hypothetical protein